jgi:hypothetical protein
MPASSLIGDLLVNVCLASATRRKRSDHLEHVGRLGRRCRRRTNEYLDLAIEIVDLLVELDVPTVKPAANQHAAFHWTEG